MIGYKTIEYTPTVTVPIPETCTADEVVYGYAMMERALRRTIPSTITWVGKFQRYQSAASAKDALFALGRFSGLYTALRDYDPQLFDVPSDIEKLFGELSMVYDQILAFPEPAGE